MLKRKDEQEVVTVENLRGGHGPVRKQTLLPEELSCGKFTMCAKMVLDPGCSIGEHAHDVDAEFCYLLEGELTILDNGEVQTVHPGDAWICGDGARHFTRNDSDQPAVFLAMILK